MTLSDSQVRKLRRQGAAGKNRLRLAMHLAGVTQVQLAAALGMVQPVISKYVRGDYKDLELNTARKFAEYFGVLIEDLFPAHTPEPVPVRDVTILQ